MSQPVSHNSEPSNAGIPSDPNPGKPSSASPAKKARKTKDFTPLGVIRDSFAVQLQQDDLWRSHSGRS